jgi:hypothetical protein
LEDLIGIIIFIIFIALRTFADRKKGMERKRPPQQEPRRKPVPEVIREERTEESAPQNFPFPFPIPIPGMEMELPGRKRVKKAKPATVAPHPEQTRPAQRVQPSMALYEEGRGVDGQGYMEGVTEERGEERVLEPVPQVLAEPAMAFPSPAELRQAIIWSEILQKPKALRGRR